MSSLIYQDFVKVNNKKSYPLNLRNRRTISTFRQKTHFQNENLSKLMEESEQSKPKLSCLTLKQFDGLGRSTEMQKFR